MSTKNKMTVGHLKRFLYYMPDKMEVTVADSKGFLIHIGSATRATDYESTVETSVVVLHPILKEEREAK